MSAPPNWIVPRVLRAATESAMRGWAVEHPHRRKPADLTPDDELRAYAWALHNVPPEQVPFVADGVIRRSSGHWPRLQQVRDEASTFLKRQAERIGVSIVPDRPLAPDATARAQHAQCVCLLRALDLDGPDVSRISQMRGVAAVTDAVMTRLRRSVTAGKLPTSRIEDFRQGAWPALPELDRIARHISAAGELALSAAAASMLPREAA